MKTHQAIFFHHLLIFSHSGGACARVCVYVFEGLFLSLLQRFKLVLLIGFTTEQWQNKRVPVCAALLRLPSFPLLPRCFRFGSSWAASSRMAAASDGLSSCIGVENVLFCVWKDDGWRTYHQKWKKEIKRYKTKTATGTERGLPVCLLPRM